MAVLACSRCGHSQHISHEGTYCPDCGNELVKATDARDVIEDTKETEEYAAFLKLKKKFKKKGWER